MRKKHSLKYYKITNTFFDCIGVYTRHRSFDGDVYYKLLKDITKQERPSRPLWVRPEVSISQHNLDKYPDYKKSKITEKEAFIEIL